MHCEVFNAVSGHFIKSLNNTKTAKSQLDNYDKYGSKYYWLTIAISIDTPNNMKEIRALGRYNKGI